jgi:predicted DNA-binding transcriptional regulator YafY
LASNKHAIIRYRTIDRCLKDRNNSWTWRELRNVCESAIEESTGHPVEISERTIKYDIAAMRSNDILGYYAPIRYDRTEKSYYYSDLQYSLTESPINKKDKQDLNNALQLLEQFMGISEITGIQTILTKLHNSIDRQDAQSSKVILFDHPLDAPDQKWLYRVYHAILQQQCITIVYHPFGKPRSSKKLSPYLLKEYKKRWYLIAYDHDREGVRVYALDRVEDVGESLEGFILHPDFNADLYFKDIVGVTLLDDSEIEEIRFEVFRNQINYFITQPLHATQRIIERKDESVVFTIKVRVNYELINEILSFGKDIKVLSPAVLVNRIIDTLKEQRRLYI